MCPPTLHSCHEDRHVAAGKSRDSDERGVCVGARSAHLKGHIQGVGRTQPLLLHPGSRLPTSAAQGGWAHPQGAFRLAGKKSLKYRQLKHITAVGYENKG